MISASKEQLQQQLEYTKPDCHSWWFSKMQSGREDTLEEQYAIKFCFKLGEKCHSKEWNASDCFSTILHESSISFWVANRDSRKAGSLWGMIRGVGGVWKSIQQSWLAKGLGLGLLCWGFKGVQEEIRSEEASTLQIGSVAFPPGQCTSPQLHPCHRWVSRQFFTLAIVQTLVPVTFGCSLSSEAVVIRQLRRWKRLWRRSLTRSHKRTYMGPCRSGWNGTTSSLLAEEITSKGTRVSWVYYQLKCPYEKSLETYLMILVCVWRGFGMK